MKASRCQFTSPQRQMVLSLISEFDEESDGLDGDHQQDADSATVTPSVLSASSAVALQAKTQKSGRKRRRVRKAAQAPLSRANDKEPQAICVARTKASAGWQPLLDDLSCDTSIQSIVNSVSTLQATDAIDRQRRLQQRLQQQKQQKQLQQVQRNSHLHSSCTTCGKQCAASPDKPLSAAATKRRRGLRKARQSQQHPEWKRELFSEYLCSGLSEEDQQENLRCLLRSTKNRSFCIRADQRKKFIDLQLAVKRRDAPIRMNRTTQLRMQQVDDSRQRLRTEAVRLTRCLSAGWQARHRQLLKLKQKLLRNQQSLEESESPVQHKCTPPQQSNRNALTWLSRSLSTVTSPSSSNDLRNRKPEKAGTDALVKEAIGVRVASRSSSDSGSKGEFSLASLTVVLDEIQQKRRRRVLRCQGKGGSSRNTSHDDQDAGTTTTADTSMTTTTTTATGATVTTETATAVGEIFKPHLGDSRPTPTLEPLPDRIDRADAPIEDASQGDEKVLPELKPAVRQKCRCEGVPDFDQLQRQVAERQRAPNKQEILYSNSKESQQRTQTLQKLRHEFIQSVEERIFGCAASGDTAVASLPADSGQPSPSSNLVGGRLFQEFNNLKTGLCQLLEYKRRLNSANPEASPQAQADLESKNKLLLSVKISQLDSLISRVKTHLNIGDGIFSEGKSGDAGLAKEATLVAEAVDGVYHKFAELTGLDSSSSNAAPLSMQLNQPAYKKVEEPCGSPGDRTVAKPASTICQEDICCQSPLKSQPAQPASPPAPTTGGEYFAVQKSEKYNESTVIPETAEAIHAKRIVAELRRQLNLMRCTGRRIKSLGDPLAAIDQRRRVSQQRAMEHDPAEARWIPVILRYRKWQPGSPQFHEFARNRCNWCKRYRESVLPLWTRTIRLDMSLHEPIAHSLVLLSSRLGKQVSTDWVLSANAFPDDSFPGKAVILDLLKSPHQSGLKPWQTVFVSETDFTWHLAELAERAMANRGRIPMPTTARSVSATPDSAAEIGASNTTPSTFEDCASSPRTMLASAREFRRSATPAALLSADAGTVTVRGPQAISVCRRVTASPAACSATATAAAATSISASFGGDVKPSQEWEADGTRSPCQGRPSYTDKGDIFDEVHGTDRDAVKGDLASPTAAARHPGCGEFSGSNSQQYHEAFERLGLFNVQSEHKAGSATSASLASSAW